jgi:hypothetical protein
LNTKGAQFLKMSIRQSAIWNIINVTFRLQYDKIVIRRNVSKSSAHFWKQKNGR